MEWIDKLSNIGAAGAIIVVVALFLKFLRLTNTEFIMALAKNTQAIKVLATQCARAQTRRNSCEEDDDDDDDEA